MLISSFNPANYLPHSNASQHHSQASSDSPSNGTIKTSQKPQSQCNITSSLHHTRQAQIPNTFVSLLRHPVPLFQYSRNKYTLIPLIPSSPKHWGVMSVISHHRQAIFHVSNSTIDPPVNSSPRSQQSSIHTLLLSMIYQPSPVSCCYPDLAPTHAN